jgi:purine-binding chemotaxis protein CheW
MSTAPTTRQLVVCSLGQEQYALPIAQVREIVRFAEPRPVAADAAGLRGVIGLRGRLLPVYDLAVRLGLGDAAAEPGPQAKIVVVETADDLAGIVVDDVVEVATVADAQLEQLPGTGANAAAATIAKLGDRLVLLLDPAVLLAPVATPAPDAAIADRAVV